MVAPHAAKLPPYSLPARSRRIPKSAPAFEKSNLNASQSRLVDAVLAAMAELGACGGEFSQLQSHETRIRFLKELFDLNVPVEEIFDVSRLAELFREFAALVTC